MLFEEPKKKKKKGGKKQVVKTKGVRIRGTGAATQGLYARGPMA
jgi:hypothetical protein